MIAALSGEAKPARASDDYVRQEFDAFADRFDATLTNWLDYRAPQLVADAVRAALGPGAVTAATIDLGCGTGLAAPLLRPLTRRLEGVDLSPRMLDKARARGGYDALHEGEIGRFLSTRRGQYTLAVACDVFCYFGELAPAFAAVAAALKPGGIFAFTVERHAGEGHALGPSGRYAHADSFVRAAGEAAGLVLAYAAEETLRSELHRPVIGGCYLFRRP
jgi:predicted TPR repeat methyltransferase